MPAAILKIPARVVSEARMSILPTIHFSKKQAATCLRRIWRWESFTSVTGQPDRRAPELPSCNLIVKRDAFEKSARFDKSILTGEDAKLCYQIRGLGLGVLYRPDVAVFHHRRPLFLPHARQVWQYAFDKAKIYHTVLGLKKWYYWSPTLLITVVSLGIVCACIPAIAFPARILLASLSILIVGESLQRSVRRSPAIAPGIILTHFAYGIGFLVGLHKTRMEARKSA